MKTYSLTSRLIAVVLTVELCSALLLIAGAGVYEGIAHFRAFDIMLRGRADSMLGAVQDAEDPQDNVMLDGTQSAAPRRDIYAVRDELGRMLGHSQNWPDPSAAFDSSVTFRTITLGHRGYRVLRVAGLRMVDPGDKGGGIPRHVVILYGAPTLPVWRSILRSISFYAALSLILLGAGAWITLLLLRRGLEPLTGLAAQAARISTQSWRFAPPPAVRQVRELAPLALALETSLAGLQRSFEQQKQFVGDAAHELKTSVAVVKSTLQTLMMRNRSPEEYRTGLTKAELDCERMEALVASMLTLAGLEAGISFGDAEAQVDLGDVASEVTEHLRSVATLSEVNITLRLQPTVCVTGERDKVRLLFSNLMHNALQHSPAGGEVRALLSIADNTAELRIEDDGDGISPEALPHVFERFYRGDASRSRRTGGTGLGLAISQAIVQGMNGTIRIESQPHRGTRVLVKLPATSTKGDLHTLSTRQKVISL